MFEVISNFWGGLVAGVAGLAGLYAFYQTILKNTQRISFAVTSFSPKIQGVPEDTKIEFIHAMQKLNLIFTSYVILKNNTSSALSKDSFLKPIEISVPKDFYLLDQAVVVTGEASSGLIKHDPANSTIVFTDIAIPTKGSLLLRITSNSGISDNFIAVHKDQPTRHWNYSSLIHNPDNFSFIFSNLMYAFAFIYIFTRPKPEWWIASTDAIFKNISAPIGLGLIIFLSASLSIAATYFLAILFSRLWRTLFPLSRGEIQFQILARKASERLYEF